ncbi:Flp family type IVb pilin [Sphingomonas sp. DT-207]|uniref:Flp family type IVb pilin n=1 Tax=Sphingomonas sp. DT-207 TaxID=3396167 RepID=UPI003F1C6D59
MRALVQLFARLIGDRRAATAVEYALIITMIVLAMFAALMAFSDVATGMWNDIAEQVLAAS